MSSRISQSYSIRPRALRLRSTGSPYRYEWMVVALTAPRARRMLAALAVGLTNWALSRLPIATASTAPIADILLAAGAPFRLKGSTPKRRLARTANRHRSLSNHDAADGRVFADMVCRG